VLRAPLLLLAAVVLAAFLVGCVWRPAENNPGPARATLCELCHEDVRVAFLETKHGKLAQTCATCHGRSAEHSRSQEGRVPSDRPLKTRAHIDRLCQSCHKKVEHPSRLNLDRKCTTCHDPHPRKAEEPKDWSPEDLIDEI